VSTACSSSAKGFAVGERWLRLGLVDAVVVGGVEALSNSLLYGFRSLGLVSAAPCKPFDAARAGISIGEASAWALLVRGPGARVLRGWGESNDAHHMSSPHPQGLGAEMALDDALARAGVDASELGFVNLHGTASAQNDDVEAALVARRYAEATHACATKGLTGHTMGAAGALEAVICLLALERGLAAGSPGTDTVDPAFGERFAHQLRRTPARLAPRLAASHSFGFGGNNAVLIFGHGA
jgi:3-oxoacyl-[acyl-carrier-protein] synthase-1